MDARERHLLRHIHNYCDLIIDDNINIVHDLLLYDLVSPFFYDENDDYITPVATAAHYGASHCLILLCEYGAATCPSSNKNRPFLNPVIAAIMAGQTDAILILLAACAGKNSLWNGLWQFVPDIMTTLALTK